MADSLDLDIVVEKSSSFGASDFAVAIPGMALLAGLAFAAHRIYTLAGRRDQDLEDGMDVNSRETAIMEDSADLEDDEESEDDSEMDYGETDDDLSTDIDENDDDLHMYFDEVAGLEDSLEMVLFDETDDDSNTDFDEGPRLEDSLKVGPLDETDEDLNTETDEVAGLEDSLEVEQHEQTEEEEEEEHIEEMYEAKGRSEEDLDTSQVVASKMELLGNASKQQIELLRNQLMEKDLLLEKKADEGREMERRFEKEMNARDRRIGQLVKEKRQLKEDLKLALEETKSTNQLLESENEDVRKVLVEKEKEVDLLKESLALRTKELEEGQEKGETMKRRLMEIEEANVTLQEKLRLTEADNESIQSLLSQAESLMALGNELLDNERATNLVLEAELQVMENGLAILRAEKAKIDEELDEKELAIIYLEKALKNEKKKNNILQPALHRGKEMENLLERAKEREKEMEASLRSLEEELEKKNLQIEDFFKTKQEVKCEEQRLQDKLDVALQYGKELEERMLKDAEERERKIAKLQNNLESTLRQEQNLKRLLECKEEDIVSLKQRESESQQEVQQLVKDCEMLKEKCETQEENRLREEKRLKEKLRIQDEALRNHDKYMLMMLLHGTAQRNFQLEQIALEHRDETMDDRTDKEKQDKGRDEDQQEKVRKGEERQYREFCNAQREKVEEYGKQWEDITHIVNDVIHGDGC
ncbi:calponin homology domain-containing protein DDB_G0272472-like [Macrobrachium rosenbergii]|uniref:calponin homology domain-containing protein DDB_G0272472-like n=1 Tax=Macrobrachium rosenbergii TaxID=79674 RepID=UPI0034D630A3